MANIAPNPDDRKGFEFPPKLLAEPHAWGVWQWGHRDGKLAKIPRRPWHPRWRLSPDGERLEADLPRDRASWPLHASFVQASKWLPYAAGLAFLLPAPIDGRTWRNVSDLVVVDLDGVRDPESGELTADARRWVGELDSYTEISQSGRGLHVWIRGAKPGTRCRCDGVPIEIYAERRFLAVTGRRLPGTPATLEQRQGQLEALYREVFGADAFGGGRNRSSTGTEPVAPPPGTCTRADAEIVAELLGTPWIARLWHGAHGGDASTADFALCCAIVKATGGDLAAAKNIFRQSNLYRPKWDRPDYSQRTLEAALRKVQSEAPWRASADGFEESKTAWSSDSPSTSDLENQMTTSFSGLVELYEDARLEAGGAAPEKACGTRLAVRPRADPRRPPSELIILKQANCRGWHCAYCGSWLRACYETRLAPLLEEEERIFAGVTDETRWGQRAAGLWRRWLRREHGKYRAFLLAGEEIGVLASMEIPGDVAGASEVPREERGDVLRSFLLNLRASERTESGRARPLHRGSAEWRFEREASTGEYLGRTPARLAFLKWKAEHCAYVSSVESRQSETSSSLPDELEFVTANLKAHQYLEFVLRHLGIERPAHGAPRLAI